MTSLEQSILKTIIWFDVFDYPLTAWEVYTYLLSPPQEVTFGTVLTLLSTSDILQQYIETREGFYFLSNRQHNVTTRKDRYLYAERKFKKALHVCRVLRVFPWIKMIAVCNTLGYSNADDDSDIDLFIITARRRVWISRVFVLAFLHLFRLNPILSRFSGRPDKRKDKIDANFFVSETALSLQPLSLPSPDIYLVHWIAQLVPLYDSGGTYARFLDANAWTRNHLPLVLPYQPSARRRLSAASPIFLLLFTVIGFFLPERMCKLLQLRLMPQTLRKRANIGSDIVISDSVLKFHDQDRRMYYREEWLERLRRHTIHR